MTSQTCKMRRNSKRSASNDPIQETSQTAQKQARKGNSQLRLSFAPPMLSLLPMQTTPTTTPTPCPAQGTEEDSQLVTKDIRADQRIRFVPD